MKDGIVFGDGPGPYGLPADCGDKVRNLYIMSAAPGRKLKFSGIVECVGNREAVEKFWAEYSRNNGTRIVVREATFNEMRKEGYL